MRLPLLAVAVVAAAAPGTSAARQHMSRAQTEQLGHGYTAQITARDRFAGSTIATRTLILRRGTTVLQRFTAQDNALRLTLVDITGDEVRDVLAWDYTGGSGGCGSFRFYAGARLREEYVHADCLDTFRARLTPGGLLTWRAMASSKSGESIHCCYSRWLKTTRRWAHGRLEIIARGVVSDATVPLTLP